LLYDWSVPPLLYDRRVWKKDSFAPRYDHCIPPTFCECTYFSNLGRWRGVAVGLWTGDCWRFVARGGAYPQP
jgi:hypothetical protein